MVAGLSTTQLLIAAGAGLIVLAVLWYAAHITYGWLKRLRWDYKTKGIKDGVLTRRRLLTWGGTLVGVGLLADIADRRGYTDGVGNVSAMNGSALQAAGGLLDGGPPEGKREFNLSAGGYDKARWMDDGRLALYFHDTPPMDQWVLVGPEPKRKVLAKGIPPEFGGRRVVDIESPVPPGQWLATGFKTKINKNTLFGIEAERTGTARFTVEPDLYVTEIGPAEDDARRATLTIRNAGSAPLTVKGVRFDGVPGTGTRKFGFFREGEQVLLPTQEATVTTESLPFADPSTDAQDAASVESYSLTIYSPSLEKQFRVQGSTVAPAGTPTPE